MKSKRAWQEKERLIGQNTSKVFRNIGTVGMDGDKETTEHRSMVYRLDIVYRIQRIKVILTR